MLHFDWSLSFLWEGSALSIYSIPRADLFRLQLHLTLVYLRLCTSSLAKGSASASITLSLFSLVAAYRAVIRCEEATHSLDCRAAPQSSQNTREKRIDKRSESAPGREACPY